MRRGPVFIIAAVLAAGVFRALVYGSGFPYQTLLSAFYVFVCFYWMYSVKRRFLNVYMKRYLMTSAAFMVFFIISRLVKYVFLYDGAASRYLWYAYYIPIIICPYLLLLSILHIGQNGRAKSGKYFKFLIIPAILLCGAVMTNDLHNLAFSFNNGYSQDDYVHGPVYFAALSFTALMLLLVIAVLFVKLKGRRFLYRVRYTAAVVLIGVIYVILYVNSNDGKMILQLMYEVPEFFCLFFISFWESLALTHAIPTNSEYNSFFRASSINAGLTDGEYNVALKSNHGITPTKEQLVLSESSPVYLSDNTTYLKSRPVTGGHFYWTEDMSELIKLDLELKETGNYLDEENALLNEAARLEEARRRTDEQNRLFDGIAKSLKPQLDRIEEILNGLPDDEAGYCREMKYAGVLGAFVKRYSNLLLLSSAESMADSSELYLCINESFSYLRLLGAFCCADIQSGIELPVSLMLLMYDLFEAVTESSSRSMSALFVRLSRDGRGLTYYIETSAEGVIIDGGFYSKAESAGFELSVEYSDGVFYAVMKSKEARL